jgi:hypothetical protein
MASSTRNVKIGVCNVTFGGLNLGLTQGGVEVTVKTDTHKVNVDQFGKTTVNEYLMGREVTAKVPLAETTVQNMVAVMPGATMTTVGGTAASGTITLGTNPTAGETIEINGVTVTFKAAGTSQLVNNECDVGATAADTAANLAAFVNAAYPLMGILSATAATDVVTLTAKYKGTDGNSIALAAGTSGATLVAMAGGTEPTSASIVSTNGVGTDLLTTAKELRFHPISKADGDVSDDFVVPLAATAGALTFAYKLENERIYNVEFTGYPDPQTGVLFKMGV